MRILIVFTCVDVAITNADKKYISDKQIPVKRLKIDDICDRFDFCFNKIVDRYVKVKRYSVCCSHLLQ